MLPECNDMTRQIKWNVDEQQLNLNTLEHTLQRYVNHVNLLINSTPVQWPATNHLNHSIIK